RIVPQEAHACAHEGSKEDTELAYSWNERDLEVGGRLEVAYDIGECDIGSCRNGTWPDCQAVEPVRDVDGIGHSHDHHHDKGYVERPEVYMEPLEERERNGRIKTRRSHEGKTNPGSYYELNEQPQTTGKPLHVAFDRL